MHNENGEINYQYKQIRHLFILIVLRSKTKVPNCTLLVAAVLRLQSGN